MALSPTEIANQALDLLGSEPIGSIDDTTTVQGRLVTRHYNRILFDMLADHPWNFATSRKNLAALETAPQWGFAYAYQVPDDCLLLRRLNVSNRRTPFRLEMGTIATDAGAPLGVLYTAKVQEPNLYAPLFVTAFVLRLAADFAMPLTRKLEIREAMTRDANNAVRAARSANSREGIPDDPDDGVYVNARF